MRELRVIAFISVLAAMSVALGEAPATKPVSGDDVPAVPKLPSTRPGHPSAFKVIYVIAGSDSMRGDKWTVAKKELATSIQGLSPTQGFNVIFYRTDDDGHDLTKFESQMVPGNTDNKKRLGVFLDHLAMQGKGNPLPALEAAFQEKPDLIYLLSDGPFTDPTNEQVIQRVNELNKESQIKINTILFLGKDANETIIKSGGDALRRIAQDSGGTFNEVDTDRLH